MTSVTVDGAGSAIRTAAPVTLFDAIYAAPAPWRSYDVTKDGQRFLMIKDGRAPRAAAASAFVVVQNWFEELRRLVPTREDAASTR